MFFKVGVLKYVAKSTGKHLCCGLFSTKLQAWSSFYRTSAVAASVNGACFYQIEDFYQYVDFPCYDKHVREIWYNAWRSTINILFTLICLSILILILKMIFQHKHWGGFVRVVQLLSFSRFRLTVTLKLWILERHFFIRSI